MVYFYINKKEYTVDYIEFPQNKYTKHYINLIETRKFKQKVAGATEAHHIFPVSIFGNNTFTVNLTHREHFIAHLLLWRIYRNEGKSEYKMQMALQCMSHMTNKDNRRVCTTINSHIFEAFRKRSQEINARRMKDKWDNDPKFRAAITKHNQEYWSNEDNKKAQSDKRKAHLADADNRAKMVEANRKLTSIDSWRKQRSTKQKELSSDAEYTKKRIDAMNTKEAKARSRANQKSAIAAMTPEERKAKYGRVISEEQAKTQSTAIKGRKKIINPTTAVVKVVKPSMLEYWFKQGYILKAKAK